MAETTGLEPVRALTPPIFKIGCLPINIRFQVYRSVQMAVPMGIEPILQARKARVLNR